MRLLPKDFIVHRLCPEVDSNSLVAIGKSRDGQITHLARKETLETFQRMSEGAAKEGIRLHIIWAFSRSGSLNECNSKKPSKKAWAAKRD